MNATQVAIPLRALPSKLRAQDIWNGWSQNYSRSHDGYIIHAFSEARCKQIKQFVSLCGVQLQESGLIKLGEGGWTPGCIKCRNILRKAGLMEQHKAVFEK